MSHDLIINDQLTIPAAELTWTAVRSSGPGGQNVNKVASKVEMRFAVATSTVLAHDVRQRLQEIAGHRIDAQGALRVTSQLTRSREHNLADARSKLAALVRRALVPAVPRIATLPTAGRTAERLRAKRALAAKKAARRWDPSR